MNHSDAIAENWTAISAGQCYDNALAEKINGLYKTGLIKAQGPCRTVDQVEVATLEWVDWFNHRRLHEHDGDLPPAAYEACYYRQHRAQSIAE
ncbi:transposase [Rhodococcus opacus]|nr:transposase [Rhodococcus opacus]